ncbi:MAG TPA: dienelactone hydrolase family protein [Xanthobacteraceae bacterium]|nr:dienelactone hydrolase family protein [Xanthobacteraceae bacterium]
MGKHFSLTAADSHKLGAYRADPAGKPKGGIVVIQEIFGVNHHIKSVADRYAALGFVAIAPAVFDRGEKNFDVGYDQKSMEAGRGMRGKITTDNLMDDTQAAIDFAKQFGKVAVIGYCMGGSVAFLSATRLNGIACAVGYYGGQIAQSAEEKPKVPTMLHFGDQDQAIPMTDVEKIKKAQPGMPIYVYHAGHGFHCDERGSFAPEAAQVAACRSQEFIAKHVG